MSVSGGLARLSNGPPASGRPLLGDAIPIFVKTWAGLSVLEYYPHGSAQCPTRFSGVPPRFLVPSLVSLESQMLLQDANQVASLLPVQIGPQVGDFSVAHLSSDSAEFGV